MLRVAVSATVKKYSLKVFAIFCGLFVIGLLIFKDLISFLQLLFPIFFIFHVVLFYSWIYVLIHHNICFILVL